MLKEIRFDHRTLQLPIIQGGMGIGVSLSSLAGHVMKEGAMGVISAAHPGYRRPDFRKDSIAANCASQYHEECARARAISEGNGLLGINIMVASTDYEHLCPRCHRRRRRCDHQRGRTAAASAETDERQR